MCPAPMGQAPDAPTFKPAMTLKQRRRQRLAAKCDSAVYGGGGRLHRCDSGYGASINESPDQSLKEEQEEPEPQISVKSSASASRWLNALSRIKKIADPWQKYHVSLERLSPSSS